MKKKICWITSDSFLDVDKDIVPSLAKHFDITWYIVITLNNSLYRYNIQELVLFAQLNKIELEIIHQKVKYKSPHTIPIYYKLFRKIKIEEPVIVYSNIFGMPFYHPLLYLCKLKNVVCATHDVIQHVDIPYRRLMVIYNKFVFKTFKNFHLFSKTQHGLFMSKYPNKNTFYTPLHLKNFGVSDKLPPKEKVVFLFFGSIRENKGLEILIEAARTVYQKRPEEFIVRICGYSSRWEHYEKLIGEDMHAFQLDIRKIPNSEIPDLFSTSHYLVLPYRDVTQSGPLFIAYNYRVPVIASDLPGFRENIHQDRNGFLFDVGDSNSLANKMIEIIDNHSSRYEDIKINLNDFIGTTMSIDAIASKYVEFFNNISK
jgi:glycosyltransferase involved in cell wall biosynthesis